MNKENVRLSLDNNYNFEFETNPSILADLQALFPYIKPKMIICQKICEEKIKEACMVNNLKAEIVIFDDKDADLEAFIRQHKGTEIDFR